MLPEVNLFGFAIDMYTVWIVLGIIVCLIFTIFAMKKCGYSATASDTIIIIGILSIILGFLAAMLVQAIYDYINDPSAGFHINGGMTFLGGLIGGVIVFVGLYFLYVYVINPRLSDGNFFKSDMNKGIWYLLRIAPISITIAHAFGRIGCLFAGCCHGHVTTAWYGVYSHNANAVVVPTQLFESIFLFILAVLGLTSKKEWSGFAGIGIGLALFGVHLVGIPLTGTSVNPARALSALVFSMFNGEDLAYKGLSLIPAIVGPFMGAFAAWSAFHAFNKKKEEAKAE